MVEEAFAAVPDFTCIDSFLIRGKTSIRCFCLHRIVAGDTVRFVTGTAGADSLPHVAVALIIMNRVYGPVDWYFMEIGAAQARQLSIGIGKQASLQQRVIREIYSRNDMTGMESYLLGFCKE